ncbi:ABC transporter substrate-binding protein [Tepidicella baoligensis]|uniref:ABC transporter substrate-binding protein n=1 Tax=Tepidicella baoligensis TaxID=2707016 RepID=UPI0015D9B8B2|nr:ABC transporter substrate-binding protein [Tepidicella baoligensis]
MGLHAPHWSRRQWLAVGMGATMLLTLPGCAKRSVRLGFMGGLTGPAADLGVAGRDGALLAVEWWNARGGVNGSPVELVVFDDRQRPSEVASLLPAIREAGLIGLVGPMTSSVAERWIPLANQERLVTVSPTVTSSDFTGQDDHFFRVCSTTKEYARLSAERHIGARQGGRYAIVRDDSNAAYSRSWAEHFTERAEQLGAQVVHQEAYRLDSPGESLAPVLARTMAHAPDTLVIVTNALDAANLLQLLRREQHAVQVITAEWSATEQLLDLAGRAAEGVMVAQYFDRNSQTPAYQAFKTAFGSRFQRSPGFAEVAAFDATHVLLSAYARRQRGEDLRSALLRIRQFEGLQQTIAFNEHGDAERRLYITHVSNGQYMAEAE